MKAQSTWLDKTVIVLIGLLVATDAALFAYAKLGTKYAPQDPNIFYRVSGDHGMVLPPDGFTSKKIRIDWTEHKPIGWAVRYAARDCEYCSKDEPRWGQLSSQLRAIGYKMVTVVPDAKSEYPDSLQRPRAVPQISYVNMEWVKRFRLSGTPTLLLFDGRQGLIWSHVGVLSPEDPSSAVRAAESAMRQDNRPGK